jgi:hypothetical protein
MFPYNSNEAQREKEITINGRWAWPIQVGKRIRRLALFRILYFLIINPFTIFMKMIVSYIITKSFQIDPKIKT